MSQATIDEQRVEEFGEQILRDDSRIMLLPLAYIGDQLDLFQDLHEEGPLSVEGLAEVSGCNARYLEEWLSAMASAGWIEYDPDGDTFDLSPEHALFLADEESQHYLAGHFEWGQAMAEMADDIKACFETGDGVAMEDHHPKVPKAIDRGTAPAFKNFLPEVWITELLPELDEQLREGARVADVGCGSGRSLVEMAHEYPESTFEGFEPNEESAQRARTKAKEHGLDDQITVKTEPASALPEAAYDLVCTFDVIHDLVDPQGVINDLSAALKPGGTYLMQEFNASEDLEDMQGPLGTLIYSFSTMYCMTVSLAHDGAGIGTCMGERLPREMCETAGFSSFEKLDFDHPFYVVYAARK